MVLCQKAPIKIRKDLYLGFPLKERDLSIQADGEIWVKGECLFQGYLEDEKLFLPLRPGGWFPTKDLAMSHPEYGITIIGRKDWQFISGGENIQPEEIEKHIKNISHVVDAVIVPQKHIEFGHIPVLFLQSEKKTHSLLSIQNELQEILPKYKLPKALFTIQEWPRIGFKIDRKKLIEIANQEN
jgi:O-succinylbenzoic acid--CoA ligase